MVFLERSLETCRTDVLLNNSIRDAAARDAAGRPYTIACQTLGPGKNLQTTRKSSAV